MSGNTPTKIQRGRWRPHLNFDLKCKENSVATKDITDIAEQKRLNDARRWRPVEKMGPYLSERQWGTVREDYSNDGNAWDYFSHDQSRSRAYHCGEDGLAGISDDKQRLCFALALWNERDPILKERSGSPTARAITARMSRSTTSTSTALRRIPT
jgi:hypothetical protein